MKFFPKHSLRARLIWQLLAFQVGIVVLLAAALTVLIMQSDLRGLLVDPQALEIPARAVSVADGQLVLHETDELQTLRKSAPGLWFIIRTDEGQMLENGPVPAVYHDLSKNLRGVNFVDIRDIDAPYSLSASGRRITGPNGTFDVLAGGASSYAISVAVMMLFYGLLGIVLVLIALIALFTIPWIVSRSFKGLSAVAEAAKGINIDQRGGRLAHTDVPSEVRPLVHAVNDALSRLDQGYEQHRRFILDAAHELRTPISILQTRIETLPADKVQARLLADAARIAALAEQLLDLQRLDRKEETFTTVDLVAVCEHVAAELAPIAIASGYQLALSSDDQMVLVKGSAGALERAVINLVQNAIDHGGQRGSINIEVSKQGIIEVSDDGPGVPQGEREQIFEPFYRVHPRESGAGLGLNLVREVMRHHGGHVSAFESPTGGAVFQLVLPT